MTNFIVHLVFLLILSLNGSPGFSQKETQDTLIILGDRAVDTSLLSMSKTDFLKAGKITTNRKGWSVNSYNFSMFALGQSIKRTVNDSMFNTNLKKAVLDQSINYRYINIEGVKLINNKGKIISPKIDTVKVKFIYR